MRYIQEIGQITDTIYSIASRVWDKANYRDYSQFIDDIRSANRQIKDWVSSLNGVAILIPINQP